MPPEPPGEKQLPCDLSAEQSVIGAILLDPKVIEQAEDRLRAEEFYDERHSMIYEAMLELRESGAGIDMVTLGSTLRDNGQLSKAGGIVYLTHLASSVPSAANISHYVEIVKDKHLHRQTIISLQRQLRQAIQAGSAEGIVGSIQEMATQLADQAVVKSPMIPVGQAAMAAFEGLEQRASSKSDITGLSSGFIDLDGITSGFQRSDLIIVAARPSVGKTAFALNIGQNVGAQNRNTVAIFSLEMSVQQLVIRMMCAEGRIDASRMRSGKLLPEDWEKVTMAIGQLSERGIFIDDSPSMTVLDIRAKCRQLQKEQGLDLILIDYLQLIAGHKRRNNRQEEVSDISRALKQLARELDVPVIALSQLSRGVEQRQDKRPMMSDLRESGSIEQDADLVAFLYRDDYYNSDSEKKNIIEIIIAKQRNGPVGTVELVFLKNYNKFVNLDRQMSAELDPEPHPQSQSSGRPIPDMYRGRSG
ncbi:replicative DNA helicase [Xylanibacillus composti]|nr:replicative DNA helicase [Xylanibacillus composti]MDT9723803.1 replicative DNA helicase [Xylanibacillus composti]